jgi:hypothetical protein
MHPMSDIQEDIVSAGETVDGDSANASLTTVTTWDGSPLTLNVNDQAFMPQTPNGTMIFAATDLSVSSEGTLLITSGGGPSLTPTLDAGATAPWISTNNWGANNLRVTNTSANLTTPVQVQAVGPGMPGVTPLTLAQFTPLPLPAGSVANGNTNPQQMQLVIQNTSGTTSVVGIVGGPQTNGVNGYVIGVNAAQTAGPGTSNPSGTPPQGYYATTTGNTYTFSFNWNGGKIFVGNVSSSQATAVTLTLRAL